MGSVLPVEVTVDSSGRIVVPEPLRKALGLRAGSTVDISRYGAGLAVVPTGRTAPLVDEDERGDRLTQELGRSMTRFADHRPRAVAVGAAP